DGEAASAVAAGKRNALQILSTLTTVSIEEVMKARGGPVWQQLYTTNITDLGEKVVARAQAAGVSAIVFTVDMLGGGMRRETQVPGGPARRPHMLNLPCAAHRIRLLAQAHVRRARH